ncbi:MAG: methyltransferase domain-containing protein [Dehalococcoidia bacterium]
MAGRLGALLMARIGGPMHEWAIDLLDPQPGDHVLEIGPAHGALIQRMAARVPEVQLAGVDPSADMVRLATRRNQTLAGEGRLDIRQGSVSAIPLTVGASMVW